MVLYCDYREELVLAASPKVVMGKCRILEAAFKTTGTRQVGSILRKNKSWVIYLHLPVIFQVCGSWDTNHQ